MDNAYWDLVRSDKRNLTDDQKVLFWWLVYMLRVVRHQGVIATPDPSPLTTDEIKAVYQLLLDQDNYMDESWTVGDKNMMVLDKDGEFVVVSHGQIQ